MNLRTKILTLSILLPLLFVVIGLHRSSAQNAKRAKRVPLTVLQSSENLINSDYSKKPVLAPSKDGQRIYSLDSMTGDLFVYDRTSKQLRKAADSLSNAEAFAVSLQGDLYLAHSDSTVQILNSKGRRLNRFPTVYPRSIAVLGNGNIVVASPSDGKLLHLYSSQGLLLGSLGELKTFDSDPEENEFLNRGQVIVGSDDQIYYVSTYAPEPYVLRFSSEGQLFGEFQIEGDAVDFQTDLTKDFLSRRRPDQSGGVTIITAATVNPDTGHLWLGMNGLSTHGTIYEYDQTGIKLREYALLLNSNNKRQNITHVKDIAVTSDSLDVLTWGGTYSLKFSDIVVADADAVAMKNSRSAKPTWRAWANPLARIMKFWEAPPMPVPAIPQAPCGQAQAYTCTANCPAGTVPSSVNCGAEIASLLGDRIATSSACTSKPIDSAPGSQTPGGCTQTVNFCNNTNGATGSLTATLNCNAVPTPTPTPEPTPEPTPSPTPEDFEASNSCPIVIDVSGNGFNLTNAANGVDYDLNGDGTAEHLSWTAAGSDDAWLALDRNGNGLIDNGSELFGNFTPQPAPPADEEKNGFLALAEYDKPENGGNADGLIRKTDSIFSSLRLWQDSNHNGISELSELHPLKQLGLKTLHLDYKTSKRTDQYGNKFRYRAKVKDNQDAQLGRWAWDVFLVSSP